MIIPDALIYPGLGFGAVLAKARSLSDGMILAGAQRLASLSPALKDPDDALLPDFAEAPSVNFEIAVAVAEQAISEGIANVEWDDKEVRERAKELQWLPVYEEYMYDENGEK
jgi:malate dehydrogenase (oxaloacetate-decarboxylating)